MDWQEFTEANRANWPPERRHVLVLIAERPEKGLPPGIAVGYLRLHSTPFFVIPGIDGNVTHFCDCLGDDFASPLLTVLGGQRWQMTNGKWGTDALSPREARTE
jgi:hypothetical protein